MPKKRPSFFERLTGAVRIDDDEEENDIVTHMSDDDHPSEPEEDEGPSRYAYVEEEESDDVEEGRLAIDLFETRDELVLKTMVAGVKADDLDVVINRQTVTIKGYREGERNIDDEDFTHQELFWGAFSRSVTLPEEIEVEEAEAVERNGLLTIRLPKVNKDKEARIKVKTN